MDPTFERLMPNFSHGTAGVAYYLATLHRETGRQEFLDTALAGARYLQSIATTEGDTCLIFHDEPDNKKLYYLGWCHGPVGTSRLWVRLDQIDPKAGWLNWAKKGAKSILASGIPEHQTPGFWNNLGQCCGSAGVADFFLDLGKLTGDAAYTAYAKRVTKNLLDRATRTPGDGLKWVHAEHRVKPEYVYAQTGYMQGAAGIGMLMLRMDAEEKGRGWEFRLPDFVF
jgi:lantibiotic modifying enzyme